MDKIIGIGNALVDVLVQLDSDQELKRLELPKGGMVLIDDNVQQRIAQRMQDLHATRATGGSASNAMLALANLGAKPGFVGRVGNDEMGNFFRNNCEATGIEGRLIAGEGNSGVANTFITPDAERTFATYLGVAGQLTAEDIVPELFEGYQLLHIEGYLVQNHELMERICKVAKQLGMHTSIDLASYNVVRDNLPFFRHLVKEYIDIVFANEEESAAFTQGKEPEEALKEIASMADVAVVKLGKRGASAMSGDEKVLVPGKSQGVVDTTAAGDFFAGGFLYGLVCGAPLQQCLEMGSLLSQHVIQVVGTRLPETMWQDIRKQAQQLVENN